jgi:nucleotide-binding universal stress UspA family protein
MSQRALEYALENYPDAEIAVLHVARGSSAMGGAATELDLAEDLEEAAEERAREIFDHARELAAEQDDEVNTEVQFGHPARAILNRAEEFDVIVIGSHGGSMSDQVFVGNVAQKVFRRSPVPVTFVR